MTLFVGRAMAPQTDIGRKRVINQTRHAPNREHRLKGISRIREKPQSPPYPYPLAIRASPLDISRVGPDTVHPSEAIQVLGFLLMAVLLFGPCCVLIPSHAASSEGGGLGWAGLV